MHGGRRCRMHTRVIYNHLPHHQHIVINKYFAERQYHNTLILAFTTVQT